MGKCKILFLAANPASTTRLQLEEELRTIRGRIREGKHGGSVELDSRWAVRPDDVELALLEVKPNVVHFSGHGSERDELIFTNDSGMPEPVSKEAIVDLFHTLTDNIQLVVLNACFSRPQAEGVVERISCAIGMNREIGDTAAVVFAASLYRGIAFGRTVGESFDLGKNALLRAGINEEQTPELLVHHDADPEKIVLVDQIEELVIYPVATLIALIALATCIVGLAFAPMLVLRGWVSDDTVFFWPIGLFLALLWVMLYNPQIAAIEAHITSPTNVSYFRLVKAILILAFLIVVSLIAVIYAFSY